MPCPAQWLSCVQLFDSLRPHGRYGARQAPVFMGFSRQEYWNGLSFPLPEGLPHPGIECASPALAGGFFTIAPPGKPLGGGCGIAKPSPNPPQSHTYFFLNPVIWGCCAKECSTMKGLAPWVKGRMLRISSADDIETFKNYVKILCNIWGSYENGEPGKLFAKTSAGKMG